MAAIWRPIPKTAGLSETAVLLRYSCKLDILSIHLTDLSQVWSEELSKAEICERARSIACSIDPFEDDSQLQILLEKIDAALRGDDGTSLSVIADGPDHFTLDMISPLPSPLPPLKWSARLGPGSREQVNSEVMVPLVCSTYMRKQQEDNLVALLAAKDGLMSKMMDKIESLGVDLVSLFPQLGKGNMLKRKRNQREALAPNVPGLGPFNEAAWRVKFDSTSHKGVDFREMSGIAFGESNTPAVQGLLEELVISVFRPLPDFLKNRKAPRKIAREETKDEFQHQITPQKVRKKIARAQKTAGSDDETTDDEGTASPTPKNRSARSTINRGRSATTTPASTKKLGTISASKRKTAAAQQANASETPDDLRKPTEVSPSLHRTTEKRISPSVTPRQPSPLLRRASTTSISSASASEDKKQPTEASKNPHQKEKLGKIGGRGFKASETARAKSPTQDDVSVDSEHMVPPPHPRTPRKLGRIGGRHPSATLGDSPTGPFKNAQTEHSGLSQAVQHEGSQKQDEDMQNDDTARSGSQRLRTPSPEVEIPEESQEEKVVRKRRELEREMSQVKTTPKKKRRF